MKGTNIGELEELIMLVVALLHDDAYGYAIQKEIKERCDRAITIDRDRTIVGAGCGYSEIITIRVVVVGKNRDGDRVVLIGRGCVVGSDRRRVADGPDEGRAYRSSISVICSHCDGVDTVAIRTALAGRVVDCARNVTASINRETGWQTRR